VTPEQAPGYAEAKARFDGAVIAARAAGSELDELRADRDWRIALDQFRQHAEESTARDAAVTAAKQRAAVEFSKAPEVVYSGLSDPDAIVAAAKAAHEAISAAMPSAPQAPGQASWPRPPDGSTPSPSTGQHRFDSKANWDAAMKEMKSKPKNSGGDPNNETLKEMREYVLERLTQRPIPGTRA
jgi:hypothetical protein